MKGVLEDEAYSYDGVGNRLTDIQQRSYTYNSANELLNYGQVAAGFSLRYDANGNLTQKVNNATGETTTYTYDSENRLVQLIAPNAQLVTYKYDPFGRRIEKSVNGTITRYVYDREDILFELDASSNIITEFVHGPGIDEPIAMIRNNQTYYYHADGLGSVIAITDSYGRVVQRYEYDSFGNITYQQDPNFKQPYTYTGREYDEESGLYYYRARYYDAKVGRFITQDPIGFAGGDVNFYVMVINNPLRFIDPFGLSHAQGCYYGYDPNVGAWRLICPNPGLDPDDFKKCVKCDWQKIRECSKTPPSPNTMRACTKCAFELKRRQFGPGCQECVANLTPKYLECLYRYCSEGRTDECGECK